MAESAQDGVDLHQFLCLVAQGVLFCPIDPNDSMAEVLRVQAEGVSLLVEKDNHLVGALGLVAVPWWYNHDVRFLTDRWFFVLPAFQHAAGALLLGEAAAIGFKAGLDIVINGHLRRRAKAIGNGIGFTLPRVIRADAAA